MLNIGNATVKDSVSIGVEVISQSSFGEVVEHLTEGVVCRERQVVSIVFSKLCIQALVVSRAFIGDIGDLSPTKVQPIVGEGTRSLVTDVPGKTVVVFPGIASYSSRPDIIESEAIVVAE